MNQNQTESKPQDVEEPRDQGLDETICSAIFVIVLVSYDCYRFQDNLGATADMKMARVIAIREAAGRGYNGGDLPVIDDAEQSSNLDSPETRHVWIESFPQNAYSRDTP